MTANESPYQVNPDEPSYEEQTTGSSNPIVRFAHRARLRKSRNLVLPFLTDGATLVDYGCGEGKFLHDIATETLGHPGTIRLLGYDPFMSSKHDDYEILSDESSIGDASVDILTCLEVCEHLSDVETATFVAFAKRVLKPGAHLLVTVPIMMGPSLLLKEGSRSILHRRLPDTSARQLVKASVLGVPPTRADDIKNSHRGYDWRISHELFSGTFTCEQVAFSPLPHQHWYGQSQALMMFRK